MFIAFLVTLLVTLLNVSATSMARLGVALPVWACYLDHIEASPSGAVTHLFGGESMKLLHLCYAALGFAVARWIFKREPMPLADPVTRFRSSGLL
jgi:hypothetical protein